MQCFSRSFSGVSTDTRTLREGDLFVALRGVHFDGHQFLKEAVEKGCSALIVARDFQGELPPSVTVISVHDPLRALGNLAQFWRARHSAEVIAVTGSNGKTTTRELIATLLSAQGSVLKSERNWNNQIGLPWTLFSLDASHRYAVVELGISRVGEMERLAEIASPNVAVLTNIQSAHLEGLGTLEKIAEEKGRLLQSVSEGGVAVLNRDDPHLRRLGEEFSGEVLWYGLGPQADVVGIGSQSVGIGRQKFRLSVHGEEIVVELPLFGRHHLYNLLAAVAVASHYRIDIDRISESLKNFQPPPMRSFLYRLPGEVFLIDDSYNGNPGSMVASLKSLADQSVAGKRIVVLGEMLELGEFAPQAHEELGEQLADFRIDRLFFYGEHADDLFRGLSRSGRFRGEFRRIEDKAQSSQEILKLLQPGDWILVKGSRGMKMEEVVQYILHPPRERAVL